MSESFIGIVRDGYIELDGRLDVPDGTRVQVSIEHLTDEEESSFGTELRRGTTEAATQIHSMLFVASNPLSA